MQECAGALDAVADGRRISKAMCCIPRMPNKPLSAYLLTCPQQLQCCKNVCDAEEFLMTTHVLQQLFQEGQQQQQQQQQHQQQHDDGDSPQLDIDYDAASAITQMIASPWAAQLSPSTPSDVSAPPSPPPAYVVAASMTARGGWKALRMRSVLQHVTAGLQLLLRRINKALDRLHALPSLDQVKAVLLKQRDDAAAAAAAAAASLTCSPVASSPLASDVLAHHRSIVGCAIKRRRFVSLLTGAAPSPIVTACIE